MKTKEAKEIVSEMLGWQFLLMGVKERKDFTSKVDLTKYSLNDLIKANELVQKSNKRKEKLYEKRRDKAIEGKEVKGCTISMICADRLIAGVYVCLNFTPNGEGVVLANDKICGVVKARY